MGKCSSIAIRLGPMPIFPAGWQVLQLRMKSCSPVRLVERDSLFAACWRFTSSMRRISSPMEQPESQTIEDRAASTTKQFRCICTGFGKACCDLLDKPLVNQSVAPCSYVSPPQKLLIKRGHVQPEINQSDQVEAMRLKLAHG